jgi:hypothetical protein
MVKIAHKPTGNKTHVQRILGPPPLFIVYSISLNMIFQIELATHPLTVNKTTTCRILPG